jgi:serine/threonine-protein kinase HipA
LKNFEIVDQSGTYIIKPPHHVYEEIPQNEDLTMKLAETVLIQVPFHGLIYNKDHSLSYFIKRFDRIARKNKIPVEDFSQLMGFDRDTKYNTSIEKTIDVINKFCTFPVIEKKNFFKSIIFNFLIGNEDMHLKNYSLITIDGITKLSPAYDLVNTSIVLKTSEEIALSLNGKKSNLKKQDFIDYLGKYRLSLSEKDIESELQIFKTSFSQWNELINISFLSENKKLHYKKIVQERQKRLFT